MELKSGKYAVVQPGQAAQVSTQGTGGLFLNGSGTLSPIQQGMPRVALVTALSVPKDSIPMASTAPVGAGSSNVAGLAPAPVVQWAPAQPTSKGAAGTSGKRSAQEDIALTVGLSVAIGLAFVIIVGAHRRRKSRKHIQS
jgi:hypothetical protein